MSGYEQANYAGYVENGEDDDYEEYKTPAQKESYGRRKAKLEKEATMKPSKSSIKDKASKLQEHKQLMQDKTQRVTYSNTSRLYNGVATSIADNEDYTERINAMMRADDPLP